jgi:hypothetical protein
VLGFLFLVFFYLFKKQGPVGENSSGTKRLLYLSAGSYVLSMIFLVLFGVASFLIYIPNRGDFTSVQRIGGQIIAANEDGSFRISGLTEMYDGGKKYPYHSVMVSLQSYFSEPVTIKGFKVISNMDGKELAGYRFPGRLPFRLKYKESRFLILRTKATKRIEEHAQKKNQDDYGSTAYLSILSSEGKLPGIPFSFTSPKVK